MYISAVLFVAVLSATTVTSKSRISKSSRTFTVDYKNNQFLKDGQPFRFASGSVHYFRIPRELWQDRIRKAKALGLNTISTYIEWSFHEPLPGKFDFSGDRDIVYFIKLAQKEGLQVILRPGPYICTERDLGGYPVWLFNIKPNIFFRTSDPVEMKYVTLWFKQLFPRLQPLLYGNGGPVIMLQIENEYGSYVVCDRQYSAWLRDLYKSYVGDKAVLFSTDGNTRNFLRCLIPGVFITVDFDPMENVTDAFVPLREIQPQGPLVNSEFYTGRLSQWGNPPAPFPGYSPSTEEVVDSLRQLLQIGASFNFYMADGGTNFAFTSGANHYFKPQITSYDNVAPISESGNLTDKYYALKAVMAEFLPIPDVEVSPYTPQAYGTVELEPKVSLFESKAGIDYGQFQYPQTFESLKLYTGLMLYETQLPQNFQGQGNLTCAVVHDRTLVYVDWVLQGVLSRTNNITSLTIEGNAGQTLGLLVENQGHWNFESMLDLKGLLTNVTLDDTILTNWYHTGYPLTTDSGVSKLNSVDSIVTPGYFSGSFDLDKTQQPYNDTFFDMTGWTKGVLYVNGVNLGRYWPVLGPQITQYCPGVYLKTHNTIVVLELQTPHPNRTVDLIDYPILRNVTPPLITDGGVLYA